MDFSNFSLITKKVDVKLINEKTGEIIFEKPQFEVPEFWSDRAATIAASKYATDAESSVCEIFNRVVNKIVEWGIKDNYFGEEDGKRFGEDLFEILINQRACFNSPILFNFGVLANQQSAAACYILSLEDTMEAILDYSKRSGMIFKWGSGAGSNISNLRAKGEKLSNKGSSSGPCSFLKIFDSTASAIRSGGKTRRSAALFCMNVDHPDIEEFITCKQKEEKKVKILIANGVSEEDAYATVSYQNANHSVMVTNEFMNAVENDLDWNLINRGNKKVSKTIKAKKLFRLIAETAYNSGDPGLQFYDRINEDNPVPSLGNIQSSNPCLTGDTLIACKDGNISIKDLCEDGKEVTVLTFDKRTGKLIYKTLVNPRMTSSKEKIYKVSFKSGLEIRGTGNHPFLLKSGDFYGLKDLSVGDVVQAVEEKFTKSIVCFDVVTKVEFCGEEPVYNGSVIDTHLLVVGQEIENEHYRFVVTKNCGELFSINESSCLLASLNLVKYLEKDLSFNFQNFDKDIKKLVVAMDIIIDNSYYPLEKIASNSKIIRQIGLGFTNLGTLLMLKGLAYGSEEGRKFAQIIAQELTKSAYRQSIELAMCKGPFEYFEQNKERVRGIAYRLTNNDKEILEGIDKYGIRNSQVTLVQPSGTIGFLMDNETTGIEPIYASGILKKMSDGSTMKIVPECVKKAIENGYTSEVIKGSVEISWKDHVKMVAEIGKVINGGISKTIIVPNDSTIEDVEQAFLLSYHLGCKGVTVYRDGSKGMQPLTAISSNPIQKKDKQVIQQVQNTIQSVRRKLPKTRSGFTHKFEISGFEGYLTGNVYEDGSVGEIFIRAQNQGSFPQGLLDAFATAISMSLQYGVPLEKLINKFKEASFDPSGWTDNEEIRFCKSVVSYIFKWLEIQFVDKKLNETSEKIEKEKLTEQENIVTNYSNPLCTTCGNFMVRSGKCWTCTTCGRSFGGCS